MPIRVNIFERSPLKVAVRAVAYDHPDAQLLTAEVLAVYELRYGGTSETARDATALDWPWGDFVVAYVEGRPAAIGGWCSFGDDAEIKRMYVREEFRGRGLARGVLAHLELTATAAGCRRTVLETGPILPGAIELYRSSGYDDIPSFGYYAGEGSVHLGKKLS